MCYGVQQVDRTSDALLTVTASLQINTHTLTAVKTHFIVSLHRFCQENPTAREKIPNDFHITDNDLFKISFFCISESPIKSSWGSFILPPRIHFAPVTCIQLPNGPKLDCGKISVIFLHPQTVREERFQTLWLDVAAYCHCKAAKICLNANGVVDGCTKYLV